MIDWNRIVRGSGRQWSGHGPAREAAGARVGSLRRSD
jgi:hypothetical protein